MTGVNWFHTNLGPCNYCGKLRYDTKKKAKADMKRVWPGDRMQVYACHGYWHYGHYSPLKSRAQYREQHLD